MRLPGLKRLVKEDFAGEDQELIDKIGFIINSSFEPLYAALNRNITIGDNLNQQLQDVTVKVNALGTPINTIQIKYLLTSSCKGLHVIRCTPTPTAAPWTTWEQTSSSLLTITNIKGLEANKEYTLRFILIGG